MKQLIPRNEYICEIFKISPVRKTLTGYGIGFTVTFKICGGEYIGNFINDYFFIKSFTNKKINFDKLKQFCICFNINIFNTELLYKLIDKKINVLISIKLDKEDKQINYVEKYLCKK